MTTPKFIALTCCGVVERVNVNAITRYAARDVGGSRICLDEPRLDGETAYINVIETPEQIDALLNMAGIDAPEGFPPVGAMVRLSGANSDGPEGERTYGGGVLVVAYTPDGLFGLFQKPGHWPFVEKLSNCRFLVADAKARGVA